MGRKKQDDIEDKIDNLFKQNLELISQNKTILAEINNKAEYTKTLEQLFMFILEVIMKKNDGTPAGNAFTSFKSNLEGFSSIFEKTKDLFNTETRDTNLLSNIPNFKSNYPMLDCSKTNVEDNSKFLPSLQASPRRGYQSISNFDRPGTPNHLGSFDFFDNDIKLSRKPSNATSTPRLLIDDYINVTSSPKTMSSYDIKHINHSHLDTPKSEN